MLDDPTKKRTLLAYVVCNKGMRRTILSLSFLMLAVGLWGNSRLPIRRRRKRLLFSA